MLRIDHLNKKYGSFQAVSDLNLHVEPGELMGFVGHNGAGKTTTLKIVAGLLSPTSGHVEIHGMDITKNRSQVHQLFGYVPDFFGVYDNLKVLEYMEFYASMYGIVGKEARKRCMELLELAQLENRPNAYVDTLSRGLKQLLCVVRSLVHDPELLLLDEPASGLDPRARYDLMQLLKKLNNNGKTIIISSHILPELADICTSIGIMHHGQLIMQGTMEEIQRRARFEQPIHIQVLAGRDKIRAVLNEDPKAKGVSMAGTELLVDYHGGAEEVAELLARMIDTGALVGEFYREKSSLEALFMEITRDEENEG